MVERGTATGAPVVGVIVAAAGSGERLGIGVPKALVPVGGRPMLASAVLSAMACPGVAMIVVAGPRERVPEVRRAVAGLGDGIPVSVVAGGATRQESVRLALSGVPPDAEIIVCHDAARPFASAGLFDRVVEAIAGGADGAVPVLRPPDTVKRLEGDVVAGTIPRGSVGLAQTPQAFAAASLRRAHAMAERDDVGATDDAMLLERAGMRVVAVPGEPSNLKITTPDDLQRAEHLLPWMLAARPAGTAGA
jgi:2-C-methyl-D-erythritol 4-phosphate cytidylyltransferase